MKSVSIMNVNDAIDIEPRKMELMTAKVETRESKCQGCGHDVYHVWDGSHTHQLFTVCACGVMPKSWSH